MVFPVPHFAARWLRHPIPPGPAVPIGCLVAGLAVAGVIVYRMNRTVITPEEKEEARRNKLAASGRIIDGNLTEARPSEGDTEMIVYEYRIAGVGYECVQDVSSLKEILGAVRVDLPVQVRYDPENPSDSIVVSETWNGLWHWKQWGDRTDRPNRYDRQLPEDEDSI
jgi:hypothetical protein